MAEPKEKNKREEQSEQPNGRKETGKEPALDPKIYLLGIPITIAIGIAIQYAYSNFYLIPKAERSQMVPPLIGTHVDKRAWFPQSSSSIFELSTPHEKSPKFRFAWYEITDEGSNVVHDISQLLSYSWDEFDGSGYGRQILKHQDVSVSVHWIKNGEAWTTRLHFKSEPHAINKKYGILIVFENDAAFTMGDSLNYLITSKSSVFGNITVSAEVLGEEVDFQSAHLNELTEMNAFPSLFVESSKATNGKVGVAKMEIPSDFQIEISFATDAFNAVTGKEFFEETETRSKHFNDRFEEVYGLNKQKMPEFYQKMGKTALSNLLASKSHYNGKIVLDGKYNGKFEYGPLDITYYSSSRGENVITLEDQIYMMTTLNSYHKEASLNILLSWLNLMNEEGYIPSAVNIVYNISGLSIPLKTPLVPQIFIAIDDLVQDEEFFSKHEEVFKSMYVRLEIYSELLMKELASSQTGIFTMKNTAQRVLFKDQPVFEGRQLDTQLYMMKMSRVMNKLSAKWGSSIVEEKFHDLFSKIFNIDFLVNHFFDKERRQFTDVVVVEKKVAGKTIFEEEFTSPKNVKNLLPLAFDLIPHDSAILTKILENMQDEQELWTTFGIRSLSKSAKESSSSDKDDGASSESTWTGDIFLPLNHWILGAFHRYASHSGPHQGKAHGIYSHLKLNLIGWVAREFKRTNSLWESYSPLTGKGNGMKNKNWSSTILLIMADKY